MGGTLEAEVTPGGGLTMVVTLAAQPKTGAARDCGSPPDHTPEDPR